MHSEQAIRIKEEKSRRYSTTLISEKAVAAIKFPFCSLLLQILNNRRRSENQLPASKSDAKQRHERTICEDEARIYITDCYAKPLWADKIQEEKACGFWYLSHHGVVNPKKPGKFCIVFDCASTFQGKSINNHM